MNFKDTFFNENAHDLGYGPIISTLNIDGNFYDKIDPPKNKMALKLQSSHQENNRKIIAIIPLVTKDNNETLLLAEKELKIIWFEVKIPAQTSYKFVKTKFSPFGFLSLVKSVTLKSGANEIKSWTANSYLLYLADLLNERFMTFFKNIFMPKFDEETEQVFSFPFIFNPSLKPWHFTTQCSLELIFNNIQNLYTSSKISKFVDIDLTKIECLSFYYVLNDLKYFENHFKFKNYTHNEIFYHASPSIRVDNLTKSNIFFGGKKPIRNCMFNFNDQSFCQGLDFFGSSIDESIKNFLGSCLKFKNPSESCFSLESGKFFKEKSAFTEDWQIIHNQQTIKIIFKKKFTTILHTNNNLLAINKLPCFFDLNLCSYLKIYWFKKICIDVSEYIPDLDEYDENIHEGTAYKLTNGLFVDMDSKICFNGISDYLLNSGITEDLYPKNKTINITRKYIDIMFSMPITNCNTSIFTDYKVVKLTHSNYRWMDLDQKYLWEIESICFKSKLKPTAEKIITNDIIKNSSMLNFKNIKPYDGNLNPIEYQMLSFEPEQVETFSSNYESLAKSGYFNFDDYEISINMENNEIFEFKKSKLFLSILYSTIKTVSYRKQSLENLDESFLSEQVTNDFILNKLMQNNYLDTESDVVLRIDNKRKKY